MSLEPYQCDLLLFVRRVSYDVDDDDDSGSNWCIVIVRVHVERTVTRMFFV